MSSRVIVDMCPTQVLAPLVLVDGLSDVCHGLDCGQQLRPVFVIFLRRLTQTHTNTGSQPPLVDRIKLALHPLVKIGILL